MRVKDESMQAFCKIPHSFHILNKYRLSKDFPTEKQPEAVSAVAGNRINAAQTF